VSPTTVAPESATSSTPTSVAPTTNPGEGGGTTSLEEFLDVDNSRPGETTQLVGRIVSLLAAMVALGGIVFLASAFRGSGTEIGELVLLLRILGGVLAVGAVVEYVSRVQGSDESFASAWSSAPGVAMALRLTGGILIAAGLRAGISQRSGRWDARSSPVALSGAAIVLASFWFDGHTVSKGVRALLPLVNTIH
jgi:copper transport protein